MRIIVIGGTGFIGSHVVARMAAEHDVTVVHRGKHPGALPASVHYIIGDRDRLAELAAGFLRHPPDVVLDMIAGDELQARAVVDAFRGIAGRLVSTSSIDVYRAYEIGLGLAPGPLEPVPLTEESPLRTALYPFRNRPAGSVPFDWVTPDYDKVIVERVVRSEPSLPATILRLPMVYGPGDPLHRFYGFLKRMDDGRAAIPIDETWAKWQAPMGYVEDVAAAIALAVTNAAAAGRTYNIAEADALSWADWARAVGQAAGWNGSVVTLPRDRTPKHLIPPFRAEQHWTARSSRIRDELGYRETVTRAEALARTVAWERAHPAPFDGAAFDYAAEDRA
jgi:nucleoside-diphosphate-sugar epimerase